MMMSKKDKGISMITLVITIVVIIILAAVSLGGSTDMINKSGEAKEDAAMYADKEQIRGLIDYVYSGLEEKVGVQLIDGALIVIDDNGKEYGSGYYLIPGGKDEEIKYIREKSGYTNLNRYQELSTSYVVNYSTKEYVRLEEVKFK